MRVVRIILVKYQNRFIRTLKVPSGSPGARGAYLLVHAKVPQGFFQIALTKSGVASFHRWIPSSKVLPFTS